MFVARVFEFGRFAAKCLEKFNLPGTFCEARHGNPLNLTSSWLNSVFSYHLAEAVARPFVPRDPIARGGNRVRYIKSGSNYCDRRGLILATCPSNVSSSRNSVSSSLSLSPYFCAPRMLSVARFTRYIGWYKCSPHRSVHSGRARQNIVVSAVVPRRRKLPTFSTFLFRTIHLSKLTPPSSLANVSTSLFLSHVSYPPFLRDTIGSRGPEL